MLFEVDVVMIGAPAMTCKAGVVPEEAQEVVVVVAVEALGV